MIDDQQYKRWAERSQRTARVNEAMWAKEREKERRFKAFEKGEMPLSELNQILDSDDRRYFLVSRTLLARGDRKTAYAVGHRVAHAINYSGPTDYHMKTYAMVAKTCGHPEEAAWAMERTGKHGHFLLWEDMARDTHRIDSAHMSKVNADSNISAKLDNKTAECPEYRADIEALRAELLGTKLIQPLPPRG